MCVEEEITRNNYVRDVKKHYRKYILPRRCRCCGKIKFKLYINVNTKTYNLCLKCSIILNILRMLNNNN